MTKSGQGAPKPLSEEVLAILRAQFSESPYVSHEPVIRSGGCQRNLEAVYDRLMKAGIPGASWHVLRHSRLHRGSCKTASIL